MKYIVAIDGTREEVSLDADGLTLHGERVQAQLTPMEGTPVRLITIGDTVHRVVVRRRASRGHYVLWLDGFVYDVEALDERTRAIRDLALASATPTGPAPVVAPMPGLVVQVHVQVGDEVVQGQGLIVMEAMKMENELRAQGAGVVKAVLVTPGTAVEKGAVLVELT
ncbi:MAG TPA: biotin/lipoyl-containing protein [Gemmatimonadaceae bacterium]|nr:biotin/lipoyl-containing protein [Gemmatimonadaceae bacterium]